MPSAFEVCDFVKDEKGDTVKLLNQCRIEEGRELWVVILEDRSLEERYIPVPQPSKREGN